MNPSVYSALMQAMTDESEGTIFDPTRLKAAIPVAKADALLAAPEAPPIPVKAEVKEPAPEALAAVGVTPPSAAPVEPTTEELRTNAPMNPPPAVSPAEARPTIRNLAQQYGIDMDDVMPQPRTGNRLQAIADISRAGNTIGSALAGAKADPSFAENLEKRGAVEAQALDKSNDDLTNFKRQLMLRVSSDKAAAKKASMMDPTSPEYLALVAQIKSNPRHAALWDKIVEQAKGFGIAPDPDRFLKDYKTGQAAGHDVSTTNLETNIGARKEAAETNRDFLREMAGTQAEISVAKQNHAEELKLAKDQREAFHPHRVLLDPSRPVDLTSARAQRELDADAQFLIGQIDELKAEIKKHGPDVLRVVPGFRGKILSLQQSVASAVLRANKYGVPTGNDWKMVENEIGDPNRFVDLVTNSEDEQVTQAAENIRQRTEAHASQLGYGPYALGSGGKQSIPAPEAPNMREIVRKGVKARTGGAEAPAPEVTEVPKDLKVKVQDENGRTGSIPASAVKAWRAKNPARKVLE